MTPPRRSKRELEHDVEDLERERSAVAGVITILSAQHAGRDVSLVPGRPGYVRIDGEVKRMTENAREKLVVVVAGKAMLPQPADASSDDPDGGRAAGREQEPRRSTDHRPTTRTDY